MKKSFLYFHLIFLALSCIPDNGPQKPVDPFGMENEELGNNGENSDSDGEIEDDSSLSLEARFFEYIANNNTTTLFPESIPTIDQDFFLMPTMSNSIVLKDGKFKIPYEFYALQGNVSYIGLSIDTIDKIFIFTPVNPIVGDVSGSIELDINLMPDLCAELDNNCGKIKIWKYLINDKMEISSGVSDTVVIKCDTCENPTCADIITDCMSEEEIAERYITANFNFYGYAASYLDEPLQFSNHPLDSNLPPVTNFRNAGCYEALNGIHIFYVRSNEFVMEIKVPFADLQDEEWFFNDCAEIVSSEQKPPLIRIWTTANMGAVFCSDIREGSMSSGAGYYPFGVRRRYGIKELHINADVKQTLPYPQLTERIIGSLYINCPHILN